MRKPLTFVIAAMSCLFVGCSAPFYYEQARFPPGYSGGLGVGACTGVATSGESVTDMPHADYYRAAFGTLYVRQAMSDAVCVFVQGSGGPGQWLSGQEGYRMASFDVQAGIKLRAGEFGALRFSAGAPSLADVTYLWDAGDVATLQIGFGFRGFTAGVTGHLRFSSRLLSHLTVNGMLSPWSSGNGCPLVYGSAGVGLEVTDWRGWRLTPLGQLGAYEVASALSVVGAGIPGIFAAPALGAGATWLVGNWCYRPETRGSFWWTLAGSYGGALVGGGTGGLVALMTRNQMWIVYGAAVLGPTGALVAYHRTRPFGTGSESRRNHVQFDLPAVALRRQAEPDGRVSTVVAVQVLNARF